jgi:hypothetical protein
MRNPSLDNPLKNGGLETQWAREIKKGLSETARSQKKGNSLTGNREWGMGNKKGRMPIPFDGDKEKKYIRLVAQPIAKR